MLRWQGKQLGSLNVTQGAPDTPPVVNKTPLFRAYNPQSGDHFYTTSALERDAAVEHGGYHAEGTACAVYPSEAPGTVPLFRLEKGEHFYTTNDAERLEAMAGGYHYEGVAGFVYPSPAAGAVLLFRLYHPGNGDHFYTINASERDTLAAAGITTRGSPPTSSRRDRTAE